MNGQYYYQPNNNYNSHARMMNRQGSSSLHNYQSSSASSEQPVFGERAFLFMWALLSNTRDWFVEYAKDVFNAITQNYDVSSLKDMKERKRKKKAYFQRLRHQMGYFTPDKKKKQQESSYNTSPLEGLESTLDSLTKMEDLEQQLMMLKEQIAIVSKNEQSSSLRKTVARNTVEKRVKSSIQQQATNIPPPPPISNIPQPPPMMMIPGGAAAAGVPPPPLLSIPTVPIVLTKPKFTIVKKDDNEQPKAEPLHQQPMSISDLIKKAGSVKLRPIQKSPGGTPMKKNPNAFQGELFAAIKNKFSSVHNLQRQDDAESDVESSSSFTCSPIRKPVPLSKVVASPKVSPKVVNKQLSTPNDMDKENMSPNTKFQQARKNIAKLFENK
ncbi:predicted protein [Naegleria gruberi]|uniref:Predicted protein n=1 Tax=Naegleria gruberi TaxID=5762 RepID=D2VDG5_NAEGR|nr:uncharacterized protein NAEGRDRAFT_66834 [Naegleria gruberi]EFC45230.1 predicted protein [Naegleria gruberi]|eukprot:XP_002677974.1 predicted protein [Naegleria gruberi strain NEG-M]